MYPDIVIPHIEQKNDILIRALPYIKKNIKFRNIYIITKDDNIAKLSSIINKKIKLLSEDIILNNYTFSTTKELLQKYNMPENRTGWYFQQFLKLGWARYSDNPWYITWDSDTFPLSKQYFFTKERIPYFIKRTEYNIPYFDTLEKILSIKKQCDFSFIAENMIFSKSIVLDMLDMIEKKAGKDFVEAIIEAVSKGTDYTSGFSEFETYGNYVLFKYPHSYTYKDVTSDRHAAVKFGHEPTKLNLLYLGITNDIVSFEIWDKTDELLKKKFNHLILLRIFSACLNKLYSEAKNNLKKFIRKEKHN